MALESKATAEQEALYVYEVADEDIDAVPFVPEHLRMYGEAILLSDIVVHSYTCRTFARMNNVVLKDLPPPNLNVLVREDALGSFVRKRHLLRPIDYQELPLTSQRWSQATTPMTRRQLETKLSELEARVDDLARSVWGVVFGAENLAQMSELSEEMLQDSAEMQKLANRIGEASNES